MRSQLLYFGTLRNDIRLAVLTLAALAAPSVAVGSDPPDNNGLGWMFTRLDLDVTIHPDKGRINVEGKAALRLNIESSMGPSIGMNANKEVMRFVRVDAPSDAMVAINQPHPFGPQIRLAHIRFADPLSRGAEVEIEFTCESRGRSSQFLINEQGALAGWTEGWHPVPLFIPNVDSHSRWMSAPGITRLRLPRKWRSWRTVSNGEFAGRSETTDGVTETWRATIPMARSFAAGPYKVARYPLGDREISVYHLSPGASAGQAQAKAVAEAIAALEARFGAYPYPFHAIVEVPRLPVHFLLSAEWGLIFAKSRVFAYTDSNLPAFAHEAAHGWWAILVNTRGPGSNMCDEALAQYSSVMAIEAVRGEKAATEFLRFSGEDYVPIQCARGYFEMWRGGRDKPLSQLQGDEWEQNLARAKGHWVYHMLRRRLGDDMFFATLRGLIRDFSGKKALSLDDLRSAFVAAAPPEAKLERFFAQWLDRPGAPILDVEWTPAGRRKAEVVVRQVQEGEPYHLRLDVAVDSKKEPRLHTIDIQDGETRVTLKGNGKPTGVRLDPNHRLLIWTPEYGPRPEPTTRDTTK